MFAHTPFQLQRTTWNENVRIRCSEKESWDIRAQNLKPFHNRLGRKRKVFPVCSQQFRTVIRMEERAWKVTSLFGTRFGIGHYRIKHMSSKPAWYYTIRFLYLWPVFILSVVYCVLLFKIMSQVYWMSLKIPKCPTDKKQTCIIKGWPLQLRISTWHVANLYIIFSMYIKRTHTHTHFTEVNVRDFFFCLCDWVTQALMKAIKSEHRSVYLRTNSSHIRFSL